MIKGETRMIDCHHCVAPSRTPSDSFVAMLYIRCIPRE